MKTKSARRARIVLLCALLCGAGALACSSDANDGTGGSGGQLASDGGPGCTPAVPAACVEVFCANNDCGGAGSLYDEHGCFRSSCDDAACSGSEECREVDFAKPSCGLDPDTGTCICGTNLAILTGKFCFPA